MTIGISGFVCRENMQRYPGVWEAQLLYLCWETFINTTTSKYHIDSDGKLLQLQTDLQEVRTNFSTRVPVATKPGRLRPSLNRSVFKMNGYAGKISKTYNNCVPWHFAMKKDVRILLVGEGMDRYVKFENAIEELR